jgi:hypothetical protein
MFMYILFFRTMSSVRRHAAAGENFFMMILQFLETFVGSMSSGALKLPDVDMNVILGINSFPPDQVACHYFIRL